MEDVIEVPGARESAKQYRVPEVRLEMLEIPRKLVMCMPVMRTSRSCELEAFSVTRFTPHTSRSPALPTRKVSPDRVLLKRGCPHSSLTAGTEYDLRLGRSCRRTKRQTT